MVMHWHLDGKVKDCKSCMDNLKSIEESGRELDRLGVWSIPKKLKKGVDVVIWKRKVA